MPDSSGTPPTDHLLAIVRNSHDRLAAALEPLSDAEVEGPSYDDDWTIAQVASHLGSGAEIFTKIVEAGLAGKEAPSQERFQRVWSVWDAKSPAEQVRDALPADQAFLDRVDKMTSEQRDSWKLDVLGGPQHIDSLLRMRLSEHVVHTWDVVVALEPQVGLADDAVPVLLDMLPGVASRAPAPAKQMRLAVETSQPSRYFRLELTGDGVTLEPTEPEHDPMLWRLELKAEAFVRLVYGRLDREHTPAGAAVTGADLADLRAAFPGI